MPHIHAADFWQSAEGIRLLTQVTDLLQLHDYDQHALALQLADRGNFAQGRKTVLSALEIVLARHKAWSLGMPRLDWLLRKTSLEQSTHPRIAQSHAARFANCHQILEICTGAGFVTAELARQANRIVSVESNPELATFARHNLGIQDLNNVEIFTGRGEDMVKFWQLGEFDGFWSDPSRRDSNGRRIMNPALYMPPLDFLMKLPIKGIRGIKVSPALSLAAVPAGWSREWIGMDRECREQVLWFGTDLPTHSVNLIDEQLSWSPEQHPRPIDGNITSPGDATYLVEPHPALIASGQAQIFLTEAGFQLLDQELVVGCSSTVPPPSPFYKVFQQISHFPYTLRRLQAAVSELGWGRRLEIKKRHVRDNPDMVRRKLKLVDTDRSGTVFLLGIGRKKFAFMTQRV